MIILYITVKYKESDDIIQLSVRMSFKFLLKVLF